MYQYFAIVDRHIDGDTIVLNIDLGFNTWLMHESVRIEGIDTPEVRTKDLEEKAAGLVALERVKQIAPVGSKVTLRSFKRQKGKFGRILGEVINSDGVAIGETLIAEGLAKVYGT